jgi:hypothetical protein
LRDEHDKFAYAQHLGSETPLIHLFGLSLSGVFEELYRLILKGLKVANELVYLLDRTVNRFLEDERVWDFGMILGIELERSEVDRGVK